MPSIRVLPEAVVNQIAAGEVVERPASVAKELIENSLDSGARRIKVEVFGGGQRSVRISDDGCGMDPADARLALTRHATSKLEEAADLARISTLGFRGEALPSIASVSRFELVTATAGAKEGTRVRVEGGGPLECEVAPAAPGTSVEVADLFFNLPARRKFLRKPATELAYLTEVVGHLALANPEVGFKLLAEGRSVFDAPGLPAPDADPGPRLVRILGKTTAEALQKLEEDGLRRPISVRGFFGLPPLSERGPRGQHVFVNGRFVQDKTVRQAVAEAYHGRLPKGRQPVVILFIEMDAGEVDVNVHPQKVEVRFARPGEVFRAVQSTLRRGLTGVALAPGAGPQDPDARRRALALAAHRTVVHPPPVDTVQEAVVPPPPKEAEPPRYQGHGERLLGALAQPSKRMARWVEPLTKPQFPSSPPPRPVQRKAEPPPPSSLPMPPERLSEARQVGVVLGRYLVLEAQASVWLVDLRGVAARVALSVEGEGSEDDVGPIQPLLVPLDVSVDPSRRSALKDVRGRLEEAGLDLRVQDEQVILHGAPARAKGLDLSLLVRAAADALLEDTHPRLAVARVLAEASIEQSGLSSLPSDPRAIEALLKRLEECPVRHLAPDGRPLVVALSSQQILALFGTR